jgi:serine/threonine-protein phosphatase 6 regulatory ankyrin repeat subunit B
MMNTMKTYPLISAILLSAVTFVTAATNDLTTAIQRGLFEEEANQNLGAAIQAYQSVANQFDKDRKLAATAIFRLGECYRKQGNTNEAATQYERVLREFSDQPTLVTLSRQNLSALGTAPAASATPAISDAASAVQAAIYRAANQQRKRLLEEEIKVVQKQLDSQQKQLQVGAVNPDALWQTEREILKLKRQVADLDAGLPVSTAATETAAPAASTETEEVNRIQALIKESPDLINAPNRIGETLLQSAAAKGKLAVVKLMLDSGAAVDGLQQPGLTALHYAAGNGHKAIVDLLLSKGAKPDAQTAGGVTALHLAAQKGYETVAKALLAAGAPVNAKTTDSEIHDAAIWALQYRVSTSGQTPLLLAVDAGYAGLLELLLAKGADVNAVDVFGRTPLSYAVDKHYQPVVQLLVAAHANPNAGTYNVPLTEAAYHGDMPALKLLLASGADPNINTNVTEDFGQIPGLNPSSVGNVTPLAVAIIQKHADAVAELIQAKADPNGSAPDGSPLIVSALGDAPMLKALLEGGADPNRLDGGGNSPLLGAVMQGAQPAVELLLAYKADPNVGRPQNQWTPLQEAAERGSKDIAEVLLKAGADVNAKSKNGWTPLLIAVSREQREVAELLLANHADPNAKSDIGQTPLHIAVNSGQRELAELLLANKADPNERDKSGRTPLDLAKSIAQQPQPMPGGTSLPPGMPMPMHAASGGIRIPPPSVSTTAPVQESKPETMADLLRRHGALDDLPHLDQIGVRRSSIGASEALFTRSAQDWSQFTLLDLIAVQYKLLAAGPDQGGGGSYGASRLWGDSRLSFPDLAHLHISRPAADLKSWQDQVLDLTAVVESGDCAKDVPLRWGDVVEVPEADHPLNEQWKGFSKEELANLKKCLTRKVEIVVKGQATTVTLAPNITGLEGGQEGGTVLNTGHGVVQFEPTIHTLTPFWLRPVLLQSKLVLISSDLSRVKVTRRDPATGQKREWVVDCSKGGDSAPNLWLQDGDRIEVPEKTSASTSQSEVPRAEAPGMAPPPPAPAGPGLQSVVRPPARALRVPAAGAPQAAVPLQYQS